MRRTLIILLALLTFGAAVAACGSDSGGDDEGKEDTEQEEPAEDEPAEEPAGPATVSVASTGIGDVLVGPDGKTLYLYASDQGNTSAVPANILSAWPPLTVASADAAVAGEGVDETKLGTAPQPDGSIWVTFNGHLLYGFSGDAAAGDTNGHKLGNIWFALTAAGDQAP
ncbi:MAG: COG4315 family predicted lipoprotein [Actinomycetota bacterium]